LSSTSIQLPPTIPTGASLKHTKATPKTYQDTKNEDKQGSPTPTYSPFIRST